MGKFEFLVIVILFSFIIADIVIISNLISGKLDTILENQRYLIEMIEVIYDLNS